MTPRLTFVVIPVLAALVLAPASYGKGQLATVPPDVVDRAVAAKISSDTNPIVAPDAIDRLRDSQATSRPIVAPDAVDRAVAARADYGSGRVFDDRFSSPTDVPAPVTVTGSDDAIEWPQVGFGFLLGIVLAGGLLAALRLTHTRPLAHR
jgi:hypothetical protein